MKYNKVPNSYRRNYKKEAAEVLQRFAICFGGALFFAAMFWIA